MSALVEHLLFTLYVNSSGASVIYVICQLKWSICYFVYMLTQVVHLLFRLYVNPSGASVISFICQL